MFTPTTVAGKDRETFPRIQLGSRHMDVSTLQSMPVFRGMHAGALEFLLERASVRRVTRGTYFYRQGDEARSVFVLVSGRVMVVRAWEGREQAFESLGHGDCFGEADLIDFSARTTSARAVVDCEVIELSAGDLYALYKQEPEQFRLIYANMGRETCRHLRQADYRVLNVESQTDSG